MCIHQISQALNLSPKPQARRRRASKLEWGEAQSSSVDDSKRLQFTVQDLGFRV